MQVKLAGLTALEAWLPRLTALPEAVVAHLRAGLGEKEALRRATLRCIVQVRFMPLRLAQAHFSVASHLGCRVSQAGVVCFSIMNVGESHTAGNSTLN